VVQRLRQEHRRRRQRCRCCYCWCRRSSRGCSRDSRSSGNGSSRWGTCWYRWLRGSWWSGGVDIGCRGGRRRRCRWLGARDCSSSSSSSIARGRRGNIGWCGGCRRRRRVRRARQRWLRRRGWLQRLRRSDVVIRRQTGERAQHRRQMQGRTQRRERGSEAGCRNTRRGGSCCVCGCCW